MNLSDTSNVIQTIALIYFAWQQNRIFERQNEIFAAQAGRSVVSPSNRQIWILRLKRYWPTVIMLLIMAMTIFDIYDRHHVPSRQAINTQWANGYTYIDVKDKTFTNETVKLDGKHFRRCHFESVTFSYDGDGPVMIEESTIGGANHLHTNDPIVQESLKIVRMITKAAESQGRGVE